MKRLLRVVCSLGVFLMGLCVAQAQAAQPKVFYINAYHQGYAWSDDIQKGIEGVLKGKADLKVFYLDTKRNGSKEFGAAQGAKCKAEIEAYKPDVLIASDDNSIKYVIQPFFMDGKIPLVYCGLNFDDSMYKFDHNNVTGMLEVGSDGRLVLEMQNISKGSRIGVIGFDNETTKKEMDYMTTKAKMNIKEYLAKDMNDWIAGLNKLQAESDMIIFLSDGGMFNDKKAEFVDLLKKNTKVVTGSTYDFMSYATIITFGRLGSEQGEWSAATALRVANGEKPGTIPIVKNRKGVLIVNQDLARAAGITVPEMLLKSADKIIDSTKQ